MNKVKYKIYDKLSQEEENLTIGKGDLYVTRSQVLDLIDLKCRADVIPSEIYGDTFKKFRENYPSLIIVRLIKRRNIG